MRFNKELVLRVLEEEIERVKYSCFNGRSESQRLDFNKEREQQIHELQKAVESINALN